MNPFVIALALIFPAGPVAAQQSSPFSVESEEKITVFQEVLIRRGTSLLEVRCTKDTLRGDSYEPLTLTCSGKTILAESDLQVGGPISVIRWKHPKELFRAFGFTFVTKTIQERRAAVLYRPFMSPIIPTDIDSFKTLASSKASYTPEEIVEAVVRAQRRIQTQQEQKNIQQLGEKLNSPGVFD